MKFEEALYKDGNETRMYRIEEISQMRERSEEKFLKVRSCLFCPDCGKPHLSHNACEPLKSDYFSTFPRQLHDEGCPFIHEQATSAQVDWYVEQDKDCKKINNKLKSCLLQLLKGGNKTTASPYIIEIDKTQMSDSGRNEKQSKKSVYIPRKRLTNGISEDDKDVTKIFYGHVKLKCELNSSNIYCLKFYKLTDSREILVCSLSYKEKVARYMPISPNTNCECDVAFLANLSRGRKKDRGRGFYYNGWLNDSRLIVFKF